MDIVNVGNRRSLRLREYNYTREGAYFVTLCARDRQCLFGDVMDGGMRMNEAGRMIQTVWDHLPERFPHIRLDASIVMPNHFHGIVIITNNPTIPKPVGAPLVGALSDDMGALSDDMGALSDDMGALPDMEILEVITHDMKGDDHHDCTDNVGPDTIAAGIDRAGTIRAGTRPAPTGMGGGRVSLGNIVGAFKSITTHEYIRGVKTHDWPPFNGHLWQRDYFDRVIRDDREMEHIVEYIVNNPRHWEEDEENPGNADIVR